MALSDLLKDLDPKFASALSEISSHLRQEFDEKLSATRAELGLEAAAPAPVEAPAAEAPAAPAAAAADSLDPLEELKHAVVAIDAAGSQGEILSSLVAGCARYASRCAVFLLRDGQVSGWTSHGFSLSEDETRAVAFAAEADSPWERLSSGEGAVALGPEECASLCARLGGESPEMGLLIPFVLNNQTAAGVYCDRADDGAPLNVSALQLVTFIASQVLENLPVRDRESTTTLRLAAASAAAAEPAEAAAVEVPQAPEAPEAPAADIETAAEPDEDATWGEPEPVEPEPEVEIPSATEVVDSADGTESSEAATAPQDAGASFAEAGPDALFTADDAADVAAASDAPAVHEPRMPETELAAPAPVPQAVTTSPEIVPAEADAPPPTILSDATTQVEPPSDLEGPGWAFTGASTPAPESGDESQHEEARRLARLLVTEVKLYNEELVEKGRKKGDVYSVLREDIDRSRQIFEDRIAGDVRAHSDYFREALVRILAGGDPSVLGT